MIKIGLIGFDQILEGEIQHVPSPVVAICIPPWNHIAVIPRIGGKGQAPLLQIGNTVCSQPGSSRLLKSRKKNSRGRIPSGSSERRFSDASVFRVSAALCIFGECAGAYEADRSDGPGGRDCDGFKSNGPPVQRDTNLCRQKNSSTAARAASTGAFLEKELQHFPT